LETSQQNVHSDEPQEKWMLKSNKAKKDSGSTSMKT